MGQPSRREFLGSALKLGATAAVLPSVAPAAARPLPSGPPLPRTLPELPSHVAIDRTGDGLKAANAQGARFTVPGVEVTLTPGAAGTAIHVHCPAGPLNRVVLRWAAPCPEETLYLGDAWERSYGDLQWRFLQPERVLPWYFAAHHAPSGQTWMAGVRTQPAALCFWTVDAQGPALWLDFRNGGSPSLPGDRQIAAATVVSWTSHPGETPLAALTRFCRALCPTPRLPAAPVCGNNNWYYAYGLDFDANAMRRDAHFLAGLAAGHRTQPYCVIDAGWTPGSLSLGGPWSRGDAVRFPDMAGLAADMNRLGVKAGIWVRPTALTVVDDAKRLRSGPDSGAEKSLDLTLPENAALIHADIARIRAWGYDLIKHDYSSWDVFTRWGLDYGAEVTDSGWHHADRSLTNAEIILRHYRNVRSAAGDAVVIGCNTLSHLAAGLFELQRTGDDTSGKVWERTRRQGINTLAYRLPQHRTFYHCDADCAAQTARTPWEFNRQFLDLVARSGTALFVSADPRTVTAEQKAAFRAAMQTALSGGEPGGCKPLDWLHTTAPRSWHCGDQLITYRWEEPTGAPPFRV